MFEERKLIGIEMMMRIGALVLVISMAITLSGCMTSMYLASGGLGSNQSQLKTVSDQLVDKDMIYAVGEPASKEIRDKFPNALFMVGEKNTYAIISGGELVGKIVGTFDPTLIKLDQKSITLEVSDKEFSGAITIYYKKTWEEMSNEEREVVKKFNFESYPSFFKKYYLKKFSFSGVISPRAANFDSIKSKFSRPRTVELHAVKRKYVTERNTDLKAIIELPVMIAIDVYTAPIQLLFFAATGVAAK